MASKVETQPSAGDFFSRQKALFDQGFSFSGYERDLFMLGKGDGTFEDVSGVSGIDSVGDGRGAAFADFDDDGDLDVFLREMHDQAHRLYRNDMGQDAGWVRVSLVGTTHGRDAFGATVRVGTSAGTLTRVKAGGSGFLAESDPRLLFGLGQDAEAKWIDVTWPGGRTQRFPGPKARQSVRIVEGESAWTVVQERTFRLPDPDTPETALWRTLSLKRGAAFPALPLSRPDGHAAPAAALGLGRGKPIVVSMWATWCTPCAKEMPALERLAHEAGTPVAVVGVSVDGAETRHDVPAVLAARKITYPVYVASPEALRRIYAGRDVRVPLLLLVDGRGRVSEALSGWSPEAEARVRAWAAAAR